MNKTVRYIIIGLSIALGLFSIWYFINIVSYILVSAVLGLIGKPIVEILGKLKILKKTLPVSIRAGVTIVIFWSVFILFFRLFIPLIASELNELSVIDAQQVLQSLEKPLLKVESLLNKYQIGNKERFSVEMFVTEKLIGIFNVSFLSKMFSSFASLLGNLFIALFSITFITFFFLRDSNLFSDGILILVPDKHEEAFKRAMVSVRQLLRRYFLGILGQITAVFILITLGMTIVGVGFSHAIVIALIASLFNIIPYLGPILGGAIGVLLGIATHLHLDYSTELLPLITFMVLVLVIVQLTDNFVFQPLIYSNSVNAHPLEIFLVILIAGSTPAGIAGMILAIPMYTVIRVFAKEFFNQFKVVKKLTRKIT